MKREEKREMVEAMNDIAGRIWAGQSVSLPLIIRVGRVKKALIAKGFELVLKKLELPEKTFKKYM